MINIAIDGPCGAGKSTISKRVAKELGFTYLDTGAMYRAVGLFAMESKYDFSNGDITKLLSQIRLDINYDKNIDKTIITTNGIDVSDKIREHFVSKLASDISKIKEVRSFLVQMQRQIADNKNVVVDGRDIATYVLPNASFKFYLTANAEERAKRRFDELVAKGEKVVYEDILKDVIDRDFNDMNRKESPLKQANDAILIDSSGKSIEQVASEILSFTKRNDKENIEKTKDEKNNRVNNEINNNHNIDIISNKDNNVNKVFIDNKEKTEKSKKTKKKHFNWFFKVFNIFVKYVLLRIIYRPKMLGIENFITDSRAIILCNHYSSKDPFPVIGKLFGKKTKVLMKSELTNNGFLARVFDELGTIAIRRGENDIVAVKKIITLLNNDGQLMIFPEGTRNKDGTKEMLPFKEGTATFAIKTRSPLIPMIYYNKPKFWHKNHLLIGKSFDLSEFYDQKSKESKELATEKLVDKMKDLRIEVDIWVEKFGGNSKKYLKYKNLNN